MVFYFFYCVLILGIIFFPPLVVFWLRPELGFNLKSEAKPLWLMAAFVFIFGLIGGHYFDFNGVWPDAWLHFIGGGGVSAVILNYGLKRLKLKLSFFQSLVAVYLLASSLGVANEILELVLDQWSGKNFSSTRLDTWHDLLANTLGAVFFWILIYQLNKKTSV